MAYLKEFLCNRREVRIQIRSDADESVFGEIFTEREYKVLEPVIAKAALSSAGQAFPILDIGGHVGMFTIYARCFNPVVLILAFEPEERNFAAMKENLRENNVSGVVMKNVAVSGSVGVRELLVSVDSHCHSLVEVVSDDPDLENRAKSDEGVPISRKVSCTTLEQIFLKNGLERVSLVKMDCEGAEFEILGCVSAEILARIDCFYIEYHKFTPEMDPEILRRILVVAGFKVEMKESFYDRRFGFVWARR